jgi:hypothetical protein
MLLVSAAAPISRAAITPSTAPQPVRVGGWSGLRLASQPEQGRQSPAQAIVLTEVAQALHADQSERGGNGVQPGPQVAQSVQVHAVQA